MLVSHALYLRFLKVLSQNMVKKVDFGQKVNVGTLCKGIQEITLHYTYIKSLFKSRDKEIILVRGKQKDETHEILIINKSVFTSLKKC